MWVGGGRGRDLTYRASVMVIEECFTACFYFFYIFLPAAPMIEEEENDPSVVVVVGNTIHLYRLRTI